ncbi:DUF1622 domain-containing protein [Gillisia sp. Q332]|uniref:DUF1622 domain-containing protein n=1 Tax=Gillisia xinjiangensis TaxID=3384765 RepID=UPI00391C4377
MSKNLQIFVEYASTLIEVIGILIIGLGAFWALGRYLFKKQGEPYRSFKIIREELGKAILLGLEFLVAADIIATVVFETTTKSILNLGLIVLIRIILSFTLEIEIEGKFPWKQKPHKTTGKE